MWHTHTVHSKQKHSSGIRTFTRVSCPRLNRPATLSLWRHRKAKLHVSFSYRGKPRHCSAWCGRFSALCFCYSPCGKQSFLRNASTKRFSGSQGDNSYKHSLSVRHRGVYTLTRSWKCLSRMSAAILMVLLLNRSYNVSSGDVVHQWPEDNNPYYRGE